MPNKIPTSEIVWESVSIKEGGENVYFVTSDKRRETYKLWKFDNGSYEMIHKDRTPPDLYEWLKKQKGKK